MRVVNRVDVHYDHVHQTRVLSTSQVKEVDMFNLLKSVTKAVVATAVIPVSITADAVTLGGVLTDKKKPYTAENVSKIIQNLNDAVDPEK